MSFFHVKNSKSENYKLTGYAKTVMVIYTV